MVQIHGRPLLGEPQADGKRPYLAINMIATVDGRAAWHGTASGLGSKLDKRLLYELRAEADVVLHGAGTVRADPLSARVPADLSEERLGRGQSAQPLGAILTQTGDLPAEHPYYQSATVVYVTSDAPVALGGPTVEVCRVASVAAAVEDLGARGAKRILCEGGPRLNVTLFEAGLVDELFFTLAPRLLGGTDPLTIVQGGSFPPINLELRSLEQVGSEVFLRYAVAR